MPLWPLAHEAKAARADPHAGHRTVHASGDLFYGPVVAPEPEQGLLVLARPAPLGGAEGPGRRRLPRACVTVAGPIDRPGGVGGRRGAMAQTYHDEAFHPAGRRQGGIHVAELLQGLEQQIQPALLVEVERHDGLRIRWFLRDPVLQHQSAFHLPKKLAPERVTSKSSKLNKNKEIVRYVSALDRRPVYPAKAGSTDAKPRLKLHADRMTA